MGAASEPELLIPPWKDGPQSSFPPPLTDGNRCHFDVPICFHGDSTLRPFHAGEQCVSVWRSIVEAVPFSQSQSFWEQDVDGPEDILGRVAAIFSLARAKTRSLCLASRAKTKRAGAEISLAKRWWTGLRSRPYRMRPGEKAAEAPRGGEASLLTIFAAC